MPNKPWMVTVAIPAALRDRLTFLKVHPNQAMYEIIEDALDDAEDGGSPTIAKR